LDLQDEILPGIIRKNFGREYTMVNGGKPPFLNREKKGIRGETCCYG